MLTLQLSPDWTAGENRIFECIARDVKNKQSGVILIVPELISHSAERRLCHDAGDTASRYAEVLSFSRLARRVADYTHRPITPCMDNGGRVVAMASAARNLHGQLKSYASVETKPEFLTGLVDAVDEFKRCRIDAGELRLAAQKTEGTLAQKLEELSLLLEAYDALCQRGKRDPRDVMNWLLEAMEDSDFAETHSVYVDGFPDLTVQHLAILEHFVCSNTPITVSLNCDSLHSTEPAFEKASQTGRLLQALAQRAGIACEIKHIQPRNDCLYQISRRLFSGSTANLKTDDRLVLSRTETLYDECVLCAERIMELVANGARYRDIGVVCSDMSLYRSTINMVFHRCGVPMYLSGTEDILDKSVIGTVLSALDAALDRFDQLDVLRYLKSGLSPLSLSQCDRMEKYVILWNISGSRWFTAWTSHPEGLVDKWTAEHKALLDELNRDRELVMEPLIALQKGFREAVNLKEQIQALYAFMEKTKLPQRLYEMAQQMDMAGDNRGAQIANQLWEILVGALEQLYDVLGNTAWDPEVFTRLFKLLLSQYDVGTIPPVLDSVTVGPVSFMRCQKTKHLFVLGALEGYLPAYSGSKGVLSDQERMELRRLEVNLTGGALEGLQAAFSEVYGVFCGAAESVFVSCPSGRPSYVYRRLLEMAGKETPAGALLGPALTDPNEAGAYFVRHGDFQSAKTLGLWENYSQIMAKREYTPGFVSKEAITMLYGEKLKLSASQIDKQADCRYSYFLKYGLDLKELKPITVDPAEFGTYVHHVLELTASEVMEKGGFRAVSLEDTVKLAHRHSQEYISTHFADLDSSRTKYLLEHNFSELQLILTELWQELHDSEFEPIGFEVAFGKDGSQIPAVRFFGKEMEGELRGYVDRVDRFIHNGNQYFRVVDYKSGSKAFDYCDVYIGYGLQMLLYLFSLEEAGSCLVGENAHCAGVQYFMAKAPVTASEGRVSAQEAEEKRQKAWKRHGLILRDDEVLEAMESGAENKRLIVKENSHKTFFGDLADREQFRILKDYVFRLVGAMIDEIASGNVEPNPYTRGSNHNACRFCPYGSICHWQNVPGRRNYKEVDAGSFWEAVEKEVGDRG